MPSGNQYVYVVEKVVNGVAAVVDVRKNRKSALGVANAEHTRLLDRGWVLSDKYHQGCLGDAIGSWRSFVFWWAKVVRGNSVVVVRITAWVIKDAVVGGHTHVDLLGVRVPALATSSSGGGGGA